MSNFANQGGQLRGSLIEAGLPAGAATIIANIFANSVQTMRHGGQVIHDTTPAGLRQVTPESRTHALTNLDFRDGDPDFRRPMSRASEDRVRPVPNSTVVESQSPQQSSSSLTKVSGGSFTDVSPAGGSSTVALRMRGSGSHPVLDYATNSIVGKAFRTESDGFVRLQIEERQDEVIFRAGAGSKFGSPQKIDVVTRIALEGDRLVAYKSTVAIAVQGDADPDVIPVFACPS